VRWTFEAVADGETAKDFFGNPLVRICTPATQVHLSVTADTLQLTEDNTYDVATVHIEAVDENGNHLSYYQEPLHFAATGAVELIGPELVSMQGGWSGTYVRTKGEAGEGKLVISSANGDAEVLFTAEIAGKAAPKEIQERQG
jgi:beta-galactosidase